MTSKPEDDDNDPQTTEAAIESLIRMGLVVRIGGRLYPVEHALATSKDDLSSDVVPIAGQNYGNA